MTETGGQSHWQRWLFTLSSRNASFVIPWVPEDFLACGGNFRCRPKADTSSAVGRSREKNISRGSLYIKTWQKPETALETSLALWAPRVHFLFRGPLKLWLTTCSRTPSPLTKEKRTEVAPSLCFSFVEVRVPLRVDKTVITTLLRTCARHDTSQSRMATLRWRGRRLFLNFSNIFWMPVQDYARSSSLD